MFVGNHAAQHALEVTEVTLHRRLVKQRSRVFQRTEQATADFRHVQQHIELRGATGHTQPLQRHVAQFEAGALIVLPRQHGLEHRTVGQAAHRPDHFHHLFERQVLMRLGTEGLGLHLLQQGFDRQLRRHLDAHRQGVDEEADQIFHLGAQAIRRRRADHHITLPRQATEHRGPRGHDRHEQRGALALTQSLELTGQGFIEREADGAAGIILLRRTWPISRQGQQGRRAAQCLLPVDFLLTQHFTGQPQALPDRVVGVLHRQLRQWIGATGAECFVQHAQFAGQYVGGPAVRDDVVHGHKQHMVVFGHAHQTSANQRATLQIKGLASLFCGHDQQFGFGLRMLGQRMQLQGKTAVGVGNALLRVPTVFLHERRAQGFVTGDDPVQRAGQRDVVEFAAQTQTGGNVIRRTRAFQLRKEPQALLGEGQWQGLVAGYRDDIRLSAVCGLRQDLRQGDQARVGEDVGQVHLYAELLANLRDQAHDQ
ncbi:hypothetical protein FX983_06564 [Pseudomonas frederiksbergensis]|uniref:Uncharacterized protein n=1 Tax=Pseudomonas frederiksbergensis TaxID=104087 RepID=A0A6L5BL19_9PSED|nr:hypothetical protein FX983_06564 [Pseudomonas frederiksbergensis]